MPFIPSKSRIYSLFTFAGRSVQQELARTWIIQRRAIRRIDGFAQNDWDGVGVCWHSSVLFSSIRCDLLQRNEDLLLHGTRTGYGHNHESAPDVRSPQDAESGAERLRRGG